MGDFCMLIETKINLFVGLESFGDVDNAVYM